jgi:hypothetical protein
MQKHLETRIHAESKAVEFSVKSSLAVVAGLQAVALIGIVLYIKHRKLIVTEG